MKRPIENNSSPGQAIYEPFCGSGTTLVAAQHLGRHWIGIDSAPAAIETTTARLTETFGADSEANAYLTREYRPPFTMPAQV